MDDGVLTGKAGPALATGIRNAPGVLNTGTKTGKAHDFNLFFKSNVHYIFCMRGVYQVR